MKTAILFSFWMILVVAQAAVTVDVQGPDASVLEGAWEGVIEAPKRPLVLATDFSSGAAKLDATGTSSWPIEKLTKQGDVVRFHVAVRNQLFQFEGLLREKEIRGNARVGELVIPFWLERLPALPTPRDRVEAWQQDLDDVLIRFLRYDRSFTTEARNAFKERIATLRQSLQTKSDQEITVELARAVALSGNAHTRLYLIRNRTEVRRLPIRVWWFKDRLHIVRATQEQSDLLGCRILKIGSVDVGFAIERMRDIKAGNDQWKRYMSAYFLTSPDLLFGAGVIPNPEQVDLTVKCGSESRIARLAPLPLRRASTPVEAWWDLAPESRDENKAFVPALRSDSPPLYVRNATKHYWYEYLPQYRAIYVQYNRSQQAQGGMSMSQFTESLVREIEQRKPAALIFDLRFNTGGDLTVGTPLMKTVSEKLVGTPVFVITGRNTFSAGITHVVQLKQWAKATIVGEPVGDELDTWSEGGNLILPNSKLTVHYANAFHAYSKREYPDRRPYLEDFDVDSVAPDVMIESSWTDYINRRDPALEAVVKRIRGAQR
ncbi:MAG TPA: hypothetical protein VF074_20200 [Pyrinomonadaceae bacterium]